MAAVIGHLTVDAADPPSLARWWSEVLGWTFGADGEGDEAWAEPPGDQPGVLFVRVPEAKGVKNRLHLDLRPADGSDQATELRRLLDLGARPVDIGQGEVTWHVLADPEGNEFCLLRSTPGEIAALLADGEG